MERKLYTPEEVEARFDSLPQEIKTVLYSTEMATIIKQVGEKHRLHVDQIGLLEAETGDVMLGFTDTKDYPGMLAKSLSVGPLQAEAIANDINDRLFEKIRGIMKKVYEEGSKPAPITSASEPTPAPSKLPPLEPRAAPPPATPAPPITPVPAPIPTPPPPVPPKPPVPPPQNMAQAQTMLSQKTVEVAPNPKVQPPQPGNYKKDPYREPAE
jgi:hypothetical protein